MLRRIVSLFFAFAVLAPVAQVSADLLVSPQRFIFDERTRETRITLVNRGAEEATYRITFENYRSRPDGQYDLITTATSPTGERFAHKLIRYSPREVTLKPGESQTVRLMLRRPADLPAGEYRSHLKFTQIPAPPALAKPRERNTGERRLGMKLVMNYSVSIPIMVRQGETTATVDITDAKALPATGSKKTLHLRIERQGNRSVYGNIKVTFKPHKELDEIVVGELNGVSVLSPTQVRELSLQLHWPPLYRESGLLTVVFRNAENEDAYVLAEEKLEL